MSLHLLVMRHGKSDRDLSYSTDHERPLAQRGRRDAPRMARLMQAQGMAPELILTSDALRALETAQLVHEVLAEAELRAEPRLYAAGVDEHLAVLRELGDTHETVLLVGHNPGLEELVAELTGRDDVAFKTASVAVVSFEAHAWSEVQGGRGKLKALVHPRELDAEA